MFLGELTFPVGDVEGIGPAAVRSLAGLGIVNLAQLLRHYPSRYEDRITPVPLAHSSSLTPAMTAAEVISHESVRWKKGFALKVLIDDGTASAAMLCFGRNFLASKLPAGSRIRITGPFERNRFGDIQSSSFVFEPIDPERPSRDFDCILPVYPLGGSLTQGLLRRALRYSLDAYAGNIRNELPAGFMPKSHCLEQIHFPDSLDRAQAARNTLIFEELFHLQLTAARRGHALPGKSGRSWDPGLPERLIAALPFDLTADQKTVIEEIRRDAESPGGMSRLLQGEVGSGKTLVAFLACLGIIGSGRQAAFMAPTELLARQHADNAASMLEPLGVRTALFTGEVSGAARNKLMDELARGEIDLTVGTHALFSSDVRFSRLGLAVIDEQHRFGVAQRRQLAEKGESPDILALTATPIPRTLTLTAFGDMEVSSIRSMPAGRRPVETHLARMGNERKVYDFVRRELKNGHRAYFVYPLIEESEKTALKNAEEMYRRLSENILPEFPGALVHSRVSEEDKRRIMADFRSGKIAFLTATSVVEVGVDVKEATCMVVEHAERFGLSALHQLRGRVGRGEYQSYCFLVYKDPLSDEGKRRMMTMKNVSDGFILAEEDLKMRGPGDMAGVRQSGFLRFSIADPVRDLDVLLRARDSARAVIRRDPGLLEPAHRDLRDLMNTCPPFDNELLRTG